MQPPNTANCICLPKIVCPDVFFFASLFLFHQFCRLDWTQVHLNELLAIELSSKKPEPAVKLPSPRRTIDSQGGDSGGSLERGWKKEAVVVTDDLMIRNFWIIVVCNFSKARMKRWKEQTGEAVLLFFFVQTFLRYVYFLFLYKSTKASLLETWSWWSWPNPSRGWSMKHPSISPDISYGLPQHGWGAWVSQNLWYILEPSQARCAMMRRLIWR